MFSNCGQDEYGGSSGGTAGDQSGKEYYLRDWYINANRPWHSVFRYVGENADAVRKAISSISTRAALNNHIGYDQDQRLTYYYQLVNVNYDPSEITVDCESDCSASTCANIIAAGYWCNVEALKQFGQYTTWDISGPLMRAKFARYTSADYTRSSNNLIPGDIVLCNGHVTIWVGDADSSLQSSAAGTGIDLRQAASKLYTSDNYKFITDELKEETYSEKQKAKFSAIAMQAASSALKTVNDNQASSVLFDKVKETVKEIELKTTEQVKVKERRLVKGNLMSFPNLVEAPFIQVTLNGYIIGGYNHKYDKYPNFITNMEVDKINGRINTYSITLVHQVRAGEDPNVIDTLLSRTGIRNKIKIMYGDSAYGAYFKEDEAYIIDVTYNEDINSSQITYVIKALSSLGSLQEAYFDFPEVKSKPSSEIIRLLYKNSATSKKLLDSLGGMKNEQETLSKGLIPTDDAEVTIPGMKDASLNDRLNQLVSYMYDPVSPTSSYFMAFEDDAQDKAFFKIKKVTSNSNASDTSTVAKNCYYLDVGYPGNSYLTSFSIQNDVYWPMYFKYSDSISNYDYNIDYSGKLIKKTVNPLTISEKYDKFDVKLANWWKLVTNYPITATVTIKGLMKPVSLIENIYVYAQFYGKKDMASGLYSIIEQHDRIGNGGYTTTLQLLRVSN